ncbi:hypothetical protein SAMN02745127_01448 [Oceanospirillum multiglobuliferum]|uniref:Bor family protein n=1 Tax=Oceanospirillum multiglobuliferum TaxID=64969 RepID=A0A1T4PE73_9GAMM|nr:hypothetical protein [Oceanospirillum multiglobuliferum]OPX55587.1 hypothetical protein BTE48_08200 [Oceanospirillum multiglobuliferum]SJZ89802.1 hypothetical protein SAMN02745127_01448 [Oceanospirillum multiglobuliferum]
MNKWLRLVLLVVSLPLTACSTMNFVNGPEMEDTVERETWHHLGLSGVVEYSPPLDVSYSCANQQWDTVTVELSGFNVIASYSPWLPLSIYSPWTIIYECREPID